VRRVTSIIAALSLLVMVAAAASAASRDNGEEPSKPNIPVERVPAADIPPHVAALLNADDQPRTDGWLGPKGDDEQP
jgi:hypothetical protein